MVVASKSKTRVAPVPAEAVDSDINEPIALPPPNPKGSRTIAPTVRPAAAPRAGSLRTTRHPGRAVLTQANFEQDDLSGEPTPEAGEFVRPLRKIGDIHPYYDYEPDPEIAAQDKCYNLCPRPQDADCPECRQPDEEGGAAGSLLCPDCPAERDIRRIGRQPGEPDREYVPRNFAFAHYAWEPTNLYHYPIYFEDFTLERYGHTRHYLIQPFFSGAKFAVQFLGLPYQLTLWPPLTKQYSLGYYRPGEFVPCKYYQIPWNTRAALVEAGIVTGAYFLWAPGVGP